MQQAHRGTAARRKQPRGAGPARPAPRIRRGARRIARDCRRDRGQRVDRVGCDDRAAGQRDRKREGRCRIGGCQSAHGRWGRRTAPGNRAPTAAPVAVREMRSTPLGSPPTHSTQGASASEQRSCRVPAHRSLAVPLGQSSGGGVVVGFEILTSVNTQVVVSRPLRASGSLATAWDSRRRVAALVRVAG